MNETSIPKWQRELRSFLGIKSGIVLEGNVYDNFPVFRYAQDGVTLLGADNMDQTILSLVDDEKTQVIFFDPVDGFYCYDISIDKQKEVLGPLFEGYKTRDIEKDHGFTLCSMPTERTKNCHSSDGNSRYIFVSEIVRRAMLDKTAYTNKENIVFVLNFASRLDACNLQLAESNTMYLNFMAATTSVQTAQLCCNSLIMVVDKYNDVPTWVYLNNPNIRSVSVCVPDRQTRRLYLENLVGELSIYRILGDDEYAPGKKFVAQTEGLRLQELRQILQLARRKNLQPEEIDIAFRLYKYGVMDNPWENLENDILVDTERKLSERVKGQDEALGKVKSVIARAVKGLSGLQHSEMSQKPKGILFFAGPTGVGKTETAKAIADSIFGDENACIRFDMSEYREDHSDQKLFGAPPGYVGYEGGGQLTNAVKDRPFSVLLFDEIEKASPLILDKFLQILEDGRMTDGQGNTVYFGETIIIFTSNIGCTKEEETPENMLRRTPKRVPTITIEDPLKEDTEEFREKVKNIIKSEVVDYFTNIGRPELLNRIGDDNIVVFRFINVNDAKSICDYKLKKICESVETRKGIRIITDDVIEMLHRKAVLERGNGGRGVGNMLEREFLNPLANYICTLPEIPHVLRCFEDGDTVGFRGETQ